MRIRNKRISNRPLEELRRLETEYNYAGFSTRIEDDTLIVFAIPPKKPKVKKEDEKTRRNK